MTQPDDTPMVSVPLLPCPFCGSSDITEREQETHDGPYVWLICENCYVETGGEMGREACHKAWNTRALAASPPLAEGGREAVAWRWRFTPEAYGTGCATPGNWKYSTEKPTFPGPASNWRREVQALSLQGN